MKELPGEMLRAFFGPKRSWHSIRQAKRAAEDYRSRLDHAIRRCSPDLKTSKEAPVFIFSAGWRSGSTLLQRMIMQHNPDILIWGEPFHHCRLLDGMADQFRGFGVRWPKESHFLSKRGSGNITDQWVANLYPDVDDLVQAHLSFFERLFVDPARKLGRSRWGIKVVTLTIDHAMYLRWLYPASKIILLYRDPLAAYTSFYKAHEAWFTQWPDKAVATPYAFGRNWVRMAKGFIEGHKSIDALLVRYEDLDCYGEAQRIGDYLGWKVSCASSLRRIAGAEPARSEQEFTLPRIDRWLLELAAGRLRREAGYPAAGGVIG